MPGMRAVQTMPEICPSVFMDAYGRSMRKALPVGRPQPNLLEAMEMIAGTTYTTQLTEKGGRLDRLLEAGSSDGQIIEELYLAALARPPEPEERTALLNFLRQRSAHRKEALADLEWAIISSREFAYNH